jgi:hypothetical protein
MERSIRNTLEMLIRVKNFQTTTGLPVNALATGLFTQVAAAVTEMEDHGTDQEAGRGSAGGGTDDRQRLAGDLREKIRPVSRTAKSLKPDDFPGVAAQFRMPRGNSYQTLLATARAMLEHIGPVKAALIARGLPADFDEAIQAAIEALSAATDRKFGGLTVQVGGTSGLADAAKRGLGDVRELDPIMRNLLKTNPSLLAAWISASRVQRGPVRSDAEAPAAPAPPTGTPPAV